MSRRGPSSNPRLAEIAERLARGEAYRTIGEAVGLSGSRIQQLAVQYCFARHPRPLKVELERERVAQGRAERDDYYYKLACKIIELRDAGWPSREIDALMGMCQGYSLRLAKKYFHDVELRPQGQYPRVKKARAPRAPKPPKVQRPRLSREELLANERARKKRWRAERTAELALLRTIARVAGFEGR